MFGKQSNHFLKIVPKSSALFYFSLIAKLPPFHVIHALIPIFNTLQWNFFPDLLKRATAGNS